MLKSAGGHKPSSDEFITENPTPAPLKKEESGGKKELDTRLRGFICVQNTLK